MIKRDEKEKIIVGDIQEKGKRGSNFISIRGLVTSLIAIPLGGLVVSLIYTFWGHNGAYESNQFLEQRRRMVMITS